MIKIKLFRTSRQAAGASKSSINVQGQSADGIAASFVETVRQWIDALTERINGVWAQCMAYFLRKDIDDTAQGRISFARGLDAHTGATVDGGLGTDALTVAAEAIIKGEAVFSADGSFASGLTGHGARITDGRAEMDELSLRHFLEVPELRYNRVSVYVGNQWRAPGGGIIRAVAVNADGAGGTACLKLEAGEIGQVAVGDICMGIFHASNAADNADENADDNHGNFLFAGFYTAYWRIVSVADYTDPETGETYPNGRFAYECRPVSERYPRQFHPAEAMHFVCYGNASDTARQSSRYSALTYERFIEGVTDFEFGTANIRMQVGDLSGFRPAEGVDFSGYSVYCNHIYMNGHLEQLAALGDPNPYTYSVDNLADTVPVDASGNLKRPLVSDNADGSQSWLLHSSIQVRRGQKLLTLAEDGDPTDGRFALSCVCDGCAAHFDRSTLYVDSVDYQTRQTAAVEVTMDCEGRAALTYQFTIKVVRDGERGERGTAHGTRYRYAVSARLTTSSASTPPDDVDVAAWSDTPQPTTDLRPYLWMEQTPYADDGSSMSLGASSYVRLTGDRGQKGEDGLDGTSWRLRGRAAAKVATAADLPTTDFTLLSGVVYLVDSYADGVRGAAQWTGKIWMSRTVAVGDIYVVGDVTYMAADTDTNRAWVEVEGITGPQGVPGANGRTTRIYQTLTEGQTYEDGSVIDASGLCFLDFFARRDDSLASGWRVFRCARRHTHAAAYGIPDGDGDGDERWKPMGINAGAAFFSFLMAKDARIDFLEGNAIRIRREGAADYYAGMGGDFPFWAGARYDYPAPSGDSLTAYTFAVAEDGSLYAGDAHLRGTVYATAGAVGGFSIADGTLTGSVEGSRGTVTVSPSLIELRSGRMEGGACVFDTAANVTAAVASAASLYGEWTCALQLSASNSDWGGGTALDIITGNARGLRPETAFIGGKVAIMAGDDAKNVPPKSPAYADGATVAVRPGAVLLYDGTTAVTLPANPQDGDSYLLMPAKLGGSVSVNGNGHGITHSGGNDAGGALDASFSTKDHRMVFVIFKGAAWYAKVLN